ncbi:MAG: glucose 1-dehydrogenase [Acidimicrobiia bacterium]
MFDLTGRVALVTGAGQGVGAGIARCLAAQGAAIAVNDVVGERAAATVDAIAGGGGRAQAVAFDVTDRASVDAGVADATRGLGPVDILVNNAGNAGAQGMVVAPFRELDPAAWDRFVQVNLYGLLNCTKAVIDGMCDRGFGRVIAISSGAGAVGLRMGVSIYGAAKAGQAGFIRHLATENARHGVTANTLALGLMGGREVTDQTREIARQVPVGRLGTAEDVGAACAYLASDEAAWITGQTINLNGGANA